MADPKPYKRGYSFTNYQADVPDQPLPGINLDVELDKIAGASDELTKRVNAGIDVSINNDALEAVAAEVPRMVFVADNMPVVRQVADLGPNIELATELYLGAFPNDPATAGDGDPLKVGATYYNTLIGESRVWAGPTSGWIPVAKVSTGGVLQGGVTADGTTDEFYVGDYVSLMLARNGLVLEPGPDYTMTAPTVTVPGTVDGDQLTWFAILKGTTTDAAAFVRQTVLTTAGVTTYSRNTTGDPLNLTQTNHVLFGGAPFGMLTYGTDYTVADGSLVLNFDPLADELYHIFSMPRFTNSEAQAILQDFREKVGDDVAEAMRGAVSVKAFGAAGDGSTDDTAAFQAAVDAAGNGTVVVPPGVYRIHEIRCSQGTMFICTDANGEVSTNANGQAAGNVRFEYNGAGGNQSFMFRWQASATNTWLFGGGILGRPVINGANLCATGIYGASTVRQRFDVEMRNFTYAAMRLGSDNGVLSVGCKVDLKFTYGATAAVENAHGIVLTGETGNTGCTQHDIKTHGLIKHGNMVHMIGNCDNNRLTIHASKGGSQSGATGNALAFYDGAVTHPRNNTIYDIAGPIYSSAGAFGNTLVRATSEGTRIFGSGQLHIAQMVDYVNGKMYATPTFPLFERREIPASQGVVTGTASLGVVAGVGAGVICPASVISGAVWTIPGGNWTRGKIRRVRIKYSCVNASDSANVRFRVKVAVTPMGQGFTADASLAITEPGTAAGSARVAEVVFLNSANLDMVEDALVSLSVERLGAEAQDTVSGDVRIHAVEVDFAAFGPENSYASPEAYPDFRRVKN